jgi:hypothetical protein
MRFWWAVPVALVALTVSGWADKDPFKPKHSHPEKVAKPSAPLPRAARTAKGSGSTAKDLNGVERQAVKASSGKKAGRAKGARIKPVKDKPVGAINSGSKSGGKKLEPTRQGSNPYRGRLRQKHAHR